MTTDGDGWSVFEKRGTTPHTLTSIDRGSNTNEGLVTWNVSLSWETIVFQS